VDTGRAMSQENVAREELSAIISRWLAAFDEWREEIEEMRDLGSQVCVVSTQHGRGKGSGIETETRYAVLYEVRGNQIIRMTLGISWQSSLEPPASQRRGLARVPLQR
jgi:hypothetical protein